MSETPQPSSGAWSLHQILQWVASVGATLTTAALISGWGTWNELQTFMVRHESVPQDIKQIKADVSSIDGRVSQTVWRIDLLEKASKPKR